MTKDYRREAGIDNGVEVLANGVQIDQIFDRQNCGEVEDQLGIQEDCVKDVEFRVVGTLVDICWRW